MLELKLAILNPEYDEKVVFQPGMEDDTRIQRICILHPHRVWSTDETDASTNKTSVSASRRKKSGNQQLATVCFLVTEAKK